MNFVYVLVCIIGIASAVQIREFGTDKELHDAEHIKMHLEDKIAVDDVDLDADTQRFHYFTMHDLNKDYTIDGIELIKASITFMRTPL
uniref:EF-hand domain-containing protein n=1 Tax=Panagrellus redivivus TaxID=6233 RepID=A0A7E4W881_PANRE